MSKSIIENGKFNITTCTNCQCKFSFYKADLEQDGKTVTCPQCLAVNTPAELPKI